MDPKIKEYIIEVTLEGKQVGKNAKFDYCITVLLIYCNFRFCGRLL